MHPIRYGLIISLIAAGIASAQIAPWHQKTLIEDDLVNRFIDEVSGEISMNHCIEMAAYNRNRYAPEYEDTYLEAAYVLSQCKAYGFDTYEIEYFNADSIWDGEMAELWEVSPGMRKLADYDNVTAVLARGSANTELTADLVYVGRGTKDKDYEGMDVSGKVVLGESSVGALHNMAVVKRGAAGVVSCAARRPLEDPDQLPWSGLYGRTGVNTFGFNLGPRRGYTLRDRLLRGEKIKVRALVRASRQPNRHNVVSASITGSEYPEESILYCAHLFEGIVKQGANDNISGSAVLLEAGRTILELMHSGVIERPRRTIRFLWIPEFSGTIPWVLKHERIVSRTLVNINLDMVGVHLAASDSRFNLERTPYSRPSYLNDVVESVMDYVNETNWEKLHNRAFPNPITAPTGSQDPFHYYIDYHYGASDHVVFNDWGVGVPGVMLITWPDKWYHSSEDRPDKLDPTQLKRAGFITALSGYMIASVADPEIQRLCGEVFSNGFRRLGNEYQRAVEMLNFTEGQPGEVYKRALNIVKVATGQEKATLGTLFELHPGPGTAGLIDEHQKEMLRTGRNLEDQLERYYRALCSQRKQKAVIPRRTVEEKKASAVVPRPTGRVKGYYRSAWMESVSREDQRKLTTIGYRKIRELRSLIDGKRNVLEITCILDAEYETPTRVRDVMNYLTLLKMAGLIEM